jgi:ubiquinone/menaquinone biosynthesis C-methylase UbiE
MATKNRSSARASPLDRQFGHPSGVLGSVVGYAMAIEHKKLHQSVVDRLVLSREDDVLEIGFGPGTAVKLAARHAAFVAGVDLSMEMVLQAKRRNVSAIRSGRVQLQRASASALPFANETFKVVFEVNSFNHWDSKESGLKEVLRVLRSGGRFLMVLRKGHGPSLEADLGMLIELLARTGFRQIECERHQLGHGGAFVIAHKPYKII